MKYGYLPPPDPSTGQLQAWTAVTNAVKSMQRFAGLKDSGVVGEDYSWYNLIWFSLRNSMSLIWFFCALLCSDEETMALMNSPRCSLPDQGEPSQSPANSKARNIKRRRRRAISMWTRRNINWRYRWKILLEEESSKLDQSL